MSHIAVSGGTSFTALWITHELVKRGHQVSVLCQKPQHQYSGIKKKRLGKMPQAAHIIDDLPVQDMAEWVLEEAPDFFILHHHYMKDFRAADYDYQHALRVGLQPLRGLVSALCKAECQGVVYSGSFFEPGEGKQKDDSQITPYAKSKKAVWDELQSVCSENKLPLSKIVIPNPVGPLENEDRLIPILVKNANEGVAFVCRSPESISDYLPSSALAHVYGEAVKNLEKGIGRIYRPSGLVTTVREFIEIVQAELIQERLGIRRCQVNMVPSGNTTQYINSENEIQIIDWKSFWDSYADSIRKN